MRTPAGADCPYYFEDFHRGRQKQECRLVAQNPASRPWQPDLCRSCRVPRIVLANACPNLVLHAKVNPGILGLNRKVEVTADCLLSLSSVPEPEIGCGRCHEGLDARLSPGQAE
ncbi:MAG TPA: hypothetical protein VLL77_00095 [Anaerolineales bacterium]|nr:hypothetical protein [Anaerolineales bacterium]